MGDQLLTQEMSQQSEYLTCPESQNAILPWGRLLIAYNSKRTIELYDDEKIFGRSNVQLQGVEKEGILMDDLKKSTDYQLVSNRHFTIKRLKSTNGFTFRDNEVPGVIVCNGRNGLFVDGQVIAAGQMKILRNNSKISIVRDHCFCYFVYTEYANITTNQELKDTYFIGGEIGSGGNGSVRVLLPLAKVEEEDQFKLMALKTVGYSEPSLVMQNQSAPTYQGVMNEVKIMNKLNHEHVMKLYSHYVTERNIHLVFDLMKGGDLLHRIQEANERRLRKSEAKLIFTQILYGLDYLHETLGVTHRDIKPDNIFLSNKGPLPLVKIGDFGLSKMQFLMNTVCGTINYAAPEILKNDSSYTYKVDIWSCGCLFYAMLTGCHPFVEEGNFDMEVNYKILPSKNAGRLIKKMLTIDPFDRPAASHILDKTWIKSDEQIKEALKKVYENHGLVEVDENLESEMEKTLCLEENDRAPGTKNPRSDSPEQNGDKEENNPKRQRMNEEN